MPTILFSWVMLSIVVGVAADGRGRNPAWFLLALMISPLLAALLLLALPNLKTERQWQPFIQALIGWSRGRPCNSKGAASKSTFAAGDYRVNFREGGSGSTHSSGWQRLSVAERWYGLKLRDPRTSWLTVVPPRVAPRPKISGAPGSAACDRLSRSTPGRRRAVA